MSKPKVTYKEKFQKGIETDIESIQQVLSHGPEKVTIEAIDRGVMSDDSTFITIKIIAKP